MPLTFSYTFLLIAAGALLLPGRARRMGFLGLVPLGLGVAATTVRLGGDLSGLALRAAERSAPARFLEINTGLIFLGLSLVIAAVTLSLLRLARQPTEGGVRSALASWIAMLVVGGGAAPLVVAQVPLLSYISPWSALGAAAGIAAGAVILFVLGRRLHISRGVAWLDARFLERNPPALLPAGSTTFDFTWLIGFFASAIIMGITPSLRAFALATVVAGTVGHVLMRRLDGGSAIPVTAIFSLFIVPAFQFSTIVGDPAPLITELANGPVSPAAEYRIVLWLAITAWGLAGLWPLHGLVFPLVAPISGILLIRLGAHALPAGLEHWAPAFMPLALLGIWHVVASPGDDSARPRRLIEMLVALAFLGAFSGEEGVPGAYWLLGSAALVPWLYFLLRGWMTKSPVYRLLWLPLVWGVFLVVTAGLATQVTYTVLAAGGIAAATWVYHRPK